MAISRQARVTLPFHAQICSKNALRVQVKMILKLWHIETDPQGVPKVMRTLHTEKIKENKPETRSKEAFWLFQRSFGRAATFHIASSHS